MGRWSGQFFTRGTGLGPAQQIVLLGGRGLFTSDAGKSRSVKAWATGRKTWWSKGTCSSIDNGISGDQGIWVSRGRPSWVASRWPASPVTPFCWFSTKPNRGILYSDAISTTLPTADPRPAPSVFVGADPLPISKASPGGIGTSSATKIGKHSRHFCRPTWLKIGGSSPAFSGSTPPAGVGRVFPP